MSGISRAVRSTTKPPVLRSSERTKEKSFEMNSWSDSVVECKRKGGHARPVSTFRGRGDIDCDKFTLLVSQNHDFVEGLEASKRP